MAATKSEKKPADKKAADKKKGLPQPKKKVRVRNQVPKGDHGGVKLVLVEDVMHLGKQGQVVEVKPGYARNYLLPNSLAVIPSEHNLRRLDRYKQRVQLARDAKIADLKSMAEQVNRVQRIVVEALSDDNGHLFGSVGPNEIARVLQGKSLMIEPAMVRQDAPFKECGQYPDVRIALGYDIEARIEVMVIPQANAPAKR